jgi:hypothetical protein
VMAAWNAAAAVWKSPASAAACAASTAVSSANWVGRMVAEAGTCQRILQLLRSADHAFSALYPLLTRWLRCLITDLLSQQLSVSTQSKRLYHCLNGRERVGWSCVYICKAVIAASLLTEQCPHNSA